MTTIPFIIIVSFISALCLLCSHIRDKGSLGSINIKPSNPTTTLAYGFCSRLLNAVLLVSVSLVIQYLIEEGWRLPSSIMDTYWLYFLNGGLGLAALSCGVLFYLLVIPYKYNFEFVILEQWLLKKVFLRNYAYELHLKDPFHPDLLKPILEFAKITKLMKESMGKTEYIDISTHIFDEKGRETLFKLIKKYGCHIDDESILPKKMPVLRKALYYAQAKMLLSLDLLLCFGDEGKRADIERKRDTLKEQKLSNFISLKVFLQE